MCGWQWCSGYLETVETSNNSIFSITWGTFSEKERKKNKKKQNKNGLVSTRPEGEAFANYSWIKSSIVVFGFCPHYLQLCDFAFPALLQRSQIQTPPPGTDHVLCALTMKKANVLRNTCYTWRIPGYVLLSSTFFLQSKSFTEFTVIKRWYPNLHCLFIYSGPKY